MDTLKISLPWFVTGLRCVFYIAVKSSTASSLGESSWVLATSSLFDFVSWFVAWIIFMARYMSKPLACVGQCLMYVPFVVWMPQGLGHIVV
jgi:hypothetical protein